MRVAIVGQRAFGKSVFEAFQSAGHEIAVVVVPPEAPGARADALRACAARSAVPIGELAPGRLLEAETALARAEPDLAVMAYVTTFVPQAFCRIPKYGTIEFHPSLLPQHRGPSAVNWAVIQGRTQTGFTIFRPTDGLDEGPILLQRSVPIGPEDTAGSLYFEKLFPLGIAALLEVAERLRDGHCVETPQSAQGATYEGWVRDAESRISWGMHLDQIYNLVRGCNPRPGAWTTAGGRKIRLLDSRKIAAGTFGEIRGRTPGVVTAVNPQSFTVSCPGGHLEVLVCRLDDGSQVNGGAAPVEPGMQLGEDRIPGVV